MSKTVKLIKVANGRYKDRETGEERTRWLTIGKVIQTDKGPKLKLDCIPVLEEHWSGWAEMFDPPVKEGQTPPEKDDFPY
jgi:hypothetical protein